MKKQSGFTLIELMIVVAIIGILSAIAIPTYNEYILRGRIPDAHNNLMAQRVAMEQYFQDYRQYTTPAAPPGVQPSPCAAPAATKFFTYACNTLTATTYTITATGVGSMANFSYTIDQGNNRTTPRVQPGWAGAAALCWVTKKDGSC